MRLYESEVREFMGLYNIKMAVGDIAYTPEKAREIAEDLRSVVIKADVLSKGRKEAGGILFADSPSEVEYAASKILNMEINGEKVRRVLVVEKIPIKKELYYAITVDRNNRCYTAVASSEGGANVEDVSPEKIIKKLISPTWGFYQFHARQIARKLGYTRRQLFDLGTIFFEFYKMAMDYDVAPYAELNPIIETPDGKMAIEIVKQMEKN